MQHICPRTHYEVVSSERENFSQQTAEIFAGLPANDFAYTQNDIDREAFENLAMGELVRFAKQAAKRLPGYTDEMSDAELMSRLNPEIGEHLMGALHTEHLCVGNFSRFGKKTYFVTSDLAAKLNSTTPNATVGQLKTPSPCIQLVYDTQYMRDAVTAVTSSPSISEGTVTIYVLEHRLGAERLISLMAFITNKRGIEGHAQRVIMLGSDGHADLVEQIKVSLNNDPMLPFRGSLDSPKGRLVVVALSTLMYLNQENAEIKIGAHLNLNSSSPKERRRLEKTASALQYYLFGGTQ